MNYCHYFWSFQPEATQAETVQMQSLTVAPPNMKERVPRHVMFTPNQIPFARGWRTNRRTAEETICALVLDEALTSIA